MRITWNLPWMIIPQLLQNGEYNCKGRKTEVNEVNRLINEREKHCKEYLLKLGFILSSDRNKIYAYEPRIKRLFCMEKNHLDPLQSTASLAVSDQMRLLRSGARPRERDGSQVIPMCGQAENRGCKSRALEGAPGKQISTLSPQLLEVGSWLAERGHVLDSEDMGHSAEATQALLRRLEATKRDLEALSPRLERLQQTAALLESRKNADRCGGSHATREGAERSPYRGGRRLL